MGGPQQANQPMSHLQQVLQYLKAGHPVLPTQPVDVPQANLAPTMPQAAPPAHMLRGM